MPGTKDDYSPPVNKYTSPHEADCGPLCDLLKPRLYRFHLMIQDGAIHWRAWQDSALRQTPTKMTAIREAYRNLQPGMPVRKALDWHKSRARQDAKQLRDLSMSRLLDAAAPTIGDFVRVRHADATPDQLRMIADLYDVDRNEFESQLRNLQAVEIIPWDEIDPGKLRAVRGIKQTKDGAISFTMESQVQIEKRLASMEGWNAAKRTTVNADSAIGDIVAKAAGLGDSEALATVKQWQVAKSTAEIEKAALDMIAYVERRTLAGLGDVSNVSNSASDATVDDSVVPDVN